MVKFLKMNMNLYLKKFNRISEDSENGITGNSLPRTCSTSGVYAIGAGVHLLVSERSKQAPTSSVQWTSAIYTCIYLYICIVYSMVCSRACL